MAEPSKSGRLLDAVLAACAVIVTCVMLAGLVSKRKVPADAGNRVVSDWQKYVATGRTFGGDSAKVKIVEFGDFECPVCRSFTLNVLAGVMANHPNDVSLTYHYWPLSYHRFAMPAARAAECAAEQDRFQQFHDRLYQSQDSLGLKTFFEFAKETGVPDLKMFMECMKSSEPTAAIARDTKMAEALHLEGTPSILVNGTLYATIPDSAELERMVASKTIVKPR